MVTNIDLVEVNYSDKTSGEKSQIKSDKILVCVGRKPLTNELNLKVNFQ